MAEDAPAVDTKRDTRADRRQRTGIADSRAPPSEPAFLFRCVPVNERRLGWGGPSGNDGDGSAAPPISSIVPDASTCITAGVTDKSHGKDPASDHLEPVSTCHRR
ncbi:MAG TPA: hypothetical protein VFE55_01485 [Acidimicrobiia bacterium]|nr:hypothetical protein [Acidimicrobiia bacterium]